MLIDATATRDVTAWQQLRGRAMRAPATWTNDCYRVLVGLRGEGLGNDVPAALAPIVKSRGRPLRARATRVRRSVLSPRATR